MRFIALAVIFSLIFPVSCRESENHMKPFDLAPYGLPISILAPDSTTVTIKEYPDMRDISIRKDDHFYIQLFELRSNRSDPKIEKQRQLAAIRKDPTFKEVVEEFDQGFIYSKQKDSTTIDYDFRYVHFLGDKQLIFQSGVLTNFGQEDIARMVAAIRAPALH